MKKKYGFLTIALLMVISCITGCGGKNEIEKNDQKDITKYTNSDLKVSSKYNKIDDYLNSIFDESDFSGKMAYAYLNEHDNFITYPFINDKGNTVFTFYFNKDETFMFLNVIYDKNDSDSISLAKKIIKNDKFGFSVSEINEINNIITTYSATDDTEIGNYIVSNLSSGNLTIKPKEKKEESSNNSSGNQSNNNTSSTNKPSSNTNTNNNSTTNNNKPSSNNNNSSNNNQQNTNSNNNTTKPSNDNEQNKPTSSGNNQQSNSNNSVSVSKQNALRSAKDYLSVSAFSRSGLIKQLQYEKYSTEDATYAVDNCGANWNQQALKSAKDYLSVSAFSRSGLIKQLQYEGFTSEQANYGVNNCGADWNQQAAKSAKDYLSVSAFSRDGLISQLEYEGFTHDQAVYGVTQAGL